MPAKDVTACVLIIGDEILSGRTRDANLPYLAEWLNQAGIRLREARVVPDDHDVVVGAVRECAVGFDYVITTGGIGPTHDDITAQCIADAFDVALVEHPGARAALEKQYTPDRLTEARLKMALVPEGGELIENPVSGAPGFRVDNVFVLAGIPVVMQAMLEKLRDELKGTTPVQSQSVTAFIGESYIAELLTEAQKDNPEVSIGSYPFYRPDKAGACIVIRSSDVGAVARAVDRVKKDLTRRSISHIDGEP